ncbi:MAG: rubredoxin [Chlorobiaceae bacterium]|nr:rubredoxin [Chlorobiaceae bacterium]
MDKQKQTDYPAWMCVECGYVYDPAEGDPDWNIRPGVPFEELPDDWRCPVCNASKGQFKMFDAQL